MIIATGMDALSCSWYISGVSNNTVIKITSVIRQC